MTPPLAARLRPTPVCTTQASADQGLAMGVGLAVTSLLGLVFLQYALPPNADAHYWGLNPEGMRQFATHWGLSRLPKMGADAYSLSFRLGLLLLWCGYALAVLAVLQGASLKARPLTAMIAGAALMTALFCPPLLSHDVYAYAAQGRLYSLYGQNPYLTSPSFLRAVHNPAAPFVTWDTPSVYGPVWTWVEVAVTAGLRGAGLWTQVVALKLVEAGALVVSALAGRRITTRLCPGRENLTLLAIGLNPALLLEGPGSGHNDLLLVSLLLAGVALFLEKKYRGAAILLGLSVAVKLVTLLILPWAAWEYGRGRPRRELLIALAVGGGLSLLPLILGFAPLWHGAATLAAMHGRASYHADAGRLIQDARTWGWLRAHGIPPALASVLVLANGSRLVLGLYLALTVWVVRARAGTAWLSAYAVMAAALMFLAMGQPFPWYVAWFWPVCLLRWDRLHLGLSGLCFGLSLAWTAGYGILDR